MTWQTIVKYDANDTLDILINNDTPIRVCMTDTENSPGLDNLTVAKEIYLSTGLLFKIGDWQPAENGTVIANIASETSDLNPAIVEAVIAKAKSAASAFYNEFRTTISPALTDWDYVSWGCDKSIVEAIDNDANPEDYTEIYLSVLQWETIRQWRTEA